MPKGFEEITRLKRLATIISEASAALKIIRENNAKLANRAKNLLSEKYEINKLSKGTMNPAVQKQVTERTEKLAKVALGLKKSVLENKVLLVELQNDVIDASRQVPRMPADIKRRLARLEESIIATNDRVQLILESIA